MSKITSYTWLILLCVLLFVPGASRLPVIDRDEAHFAQASRQMVQTGNYFQIRFQAQTRFQKPPGINWLQAASVKLFNNGDASVIWPYRIPSILGALLSVLLTFFFAGRFMNSKTAWLASAFLASSLLLVVETHMSLIDTSLLSSVLLMEGALWMIYSVEIEGRRSSINWAIIFWLAMAYGLVLKGVTPLIGVLSVLTLCMVERRVYWLRGLRIISGLVLFIGVSLAWLMMVNQAEHSNYLMQMIHKDLLPKLKGGHESHGKPPLFHLAILPLTFWPASLFLWQGAVYAYRKRSNRLLRFLLAWSIPTWIFFELMPTKLPQYILPTFPALALICALAITEEIKKPSRWMHILQFLWGMLTIGLAISFAMLPYLLMGHVTLISIGLSVGVGILGIISTYFAWVGEYHRASIAVILSALITFPLIFTGLFPQLKPLWISRNVAQIIDKSSLSDENPLLVIGYAEPSLVFYLNTHQVEFSSIQSLSTLSKLRVVLMDRQNYEQLQNKSNFSVLAVTPGYNYNKGKWVELLLLRYIK